MKFYTTRLGDKIPLSDGYIIGKSSRALFSLVTGEAILGLGTEIDKFILAHDYNFMSEQEQEAIDLDVYYKEVDEQLDALDEVTPVTVEVETVS